MQMFIQHKKNDILQSLQPPYTRNIESILIVFSHSK